jgi:RimJ/RimL family protein N-acetyltransferase
MPEASSASIPVGVPPHSFLRPVPTSESGLRDDDVELLTIWRRMYADAFLSRFEVSRERTAAWLIRTVDRDARRRIYMVEDAGHRSYGTVGMARIDPRERHFELDGVMRGRPAPCDRAMSQAILALISWSARELGMAEVRVRVLADNPALAFYRRLGFVERCTIGLREVHTDDGIDLIEDEDATARRVVHLWRRAERG